MMSNLPVPVKEEDIDQMFEFADKDKDGKISYRQTQKEIFQFQFLSFFQ